MKKIYITFTLIIFTVININAQVGIDVPNPIEKLEVAGHIKMIDGNQGLGKIMVSDADGVASWQNNIKPISTIPLSNSNYNINNTSGQDIGRYDNSLEPSIYNPLGNIQVKLVIRYSSRSGTSYIQLRTHNGTNESFPITNTDNWTFSSTQNGGVITSDWKNWNAGTNAHEIHLFAWMGNMADHLTIENAYLLVRSQ